MRYLIDTNVISELGKGAAVIRALRLGTVRWSLRLLPERSGGRRAESRRRDVCAGAIRVVRAGFDGRLILAVDLFADRIIGIDRRVAERWGRLEGYQRAAVVDGLMAATALVNDLTVVTRNVRDFAPTGVGCLNPFAELRQDAQSP